MLKNIKFSSSRKSYYDAFYNSKNKIVKNESLIYFSTNQIHQLSLFFEVMANLTSQFQISSWLIKYNDSLLYEYHPDFVSAVLSIHFIWLNEK